MGLKRGETFVAVSVLSKDGPKKGGNFCGSKRFVTRNIVWKRLQVLQFI